MTIISLILILEVLEECNCAGMKEQDLGKRAKLFGSESAKKKKNRKA
jgi:hypothetical protein